jgi:hypothetical protein
MKDEIEKFFSIYVAPFIIYIFMKLLWFTLRKEIHFINEVDDSQFVCACWHSELLISTQAYRKVHPRHKANAMVSQHLDGEIVARTMNFMNIKPLKGSSSKGGVKVLLQALDVLKNGEEVLITPDGPRGPRHTINDGIVSLATKLKLPILTMNFNARSYWQLRSWDKFVIPKPFSKVDIYAQVIRVDDLNHKEAKELLQATMLRYTII